jgi:Asp-tRNA(Asn)/Glu-tRNA(Gln) amidotransferase A subunit family amidase
MTFNADYIGRNAGKLVLRERIQALMEEWKLDALVYPFETKPARTIAEAAPNHGETAVDNDGNRVRGSGNRLSTATSLPTIVVPVGFNTDGVNVGLEFLGKLYDEPTIVRLAYAFEQAAPNRKLPASTPLLGVEKLSY